MPHKFTDTEGREWSLALNVALLKRLRDDCDLDFNQIDKDAAIIQRLADDPDLLVSALWLLVDKQATEAGISLEMFLEALGGDSLEQATIGLLRAAVDFFPQHRRRLAGKMLDKVLESQDRATEAATAKLDGDKVTDVIDAAIAKLDRESDAELDKQLNQLTSGS